MIVIAAPLPQFFDLDGSPLSSGYVYIGAANGNPETEPISVYWDSALTQPAAQPLRTAAGVIVRSGAAARVYAATDDYSITIKNGSGALVLYQRTTYDYAVGTGLRADLANAIGGTKGAGMSGYGASQPYADNTVGKKLQEFRSAYDDGARGVSTAVDSAAIQAGCALVDAAGGGVYRVNSFIATSIDLSALSLPTTVQMIDDRYSSSGWSFTHNEGTDMQFGIRGRATLIGEGPGYVMQNLASSGNRNCTITHWYGPTHAPVVASFETWGFLSDGSWYAGREWISKGSIDTGQRGRTRQGNDGGVIWNPDGTAADYRNNPAVGFSSDIFYVWNAPLQSGYGKSGKPLGYLGATVMAMAVELRLQDDVGTTGAGIPNAALTFQTGHGPSAVDTFKVLNNYPSVGQLTVRDMVNGKDLISFNAGGGSLSFLTSIASASVSNNTLFRDSADNKLKFKDNGGVVNALY